jgi:hypothetical protein
MNAIANWRAGLWRMPILLGLLSVAGLLSALIGDGAWDALSWVALGAPTAIGIWYALRR